MKFHRVKLHLVYIHYENLDVKFLLSDMQGIHFQSQGPCKDSGNFSSHVLGIYTPQNNQSDGNILPSSLVFVMTLLQKRTTNLNKIKSMTSIRPVLLSYNTFV